jgi:hypothetical protein
MLVSAPRFVLSQIFRRVEHALGYSKEVAIAMEVPIQHRLQGLSHRRTSGALSIPKRPEVELGLAPNRTCPRKGIFYRVNGFWTANYLIVGFVGMSSVP